MLSSAISLNAIEFFKLENLYYDEYDLKTIDLKKIFYGHINLKNERNEFLKFINVLTIRIFEVFEDIYNKYDGKISIIKLSGVQNNFQQAYKSMLVEIRNFMREYNKLDHPISRFKNIRAFA